MVETPIRQRPAPRPKLSKRLWRRLREPLTRSTFSKHALAFGLHSLLRLVRHTNRPAPGMASEDDTIATLRGNIIAVWHGQHLLAPMFLPRDLNCVAMVSRSADAELNALVLGRLGIGVARGSGGRSRRHASQKGGSSALIALKKALDDGKTAIMIADIPHGTPRDAGLGIIKLAQLSGRAIMPSAITTSRRIVLHRTWDKTTLNLPFGRYGFAVGEPLYVDRNADDEALERARRRLTDAINGVTEAAHRFADGTP